MADNEWFPQDKSITGKADDTPVDHQNEAKTVSNPSIDDTPIPVVDSNIRTLARQTPSGRSRGIQQFGGTNLSADSGNRQILVNDGTVPRVLMGNQSTFGEGLFVSKSGIDVTTITNPSDFSFNSNQDTLKIVLTGTTSITMNGNNVGGSTTITIAHNLGFAPIPLAYLAVGSNFNPLPTWTSLTFDVNHNIVFGGWIQVDTDATNVYINGYYNVPNAISGPYFIKYYLLQETAN